MYWRLAYGAVFLGLVFLASLSRPTPAAEATSQCGNITTAWPTVAGERDCDGFPDSVGIPNALASEAYLGTFPYVMCPATPAQNDEPTDSWPPDFNDDQLVSGGDFLAFAPYYGQTAPPAPTRLNLNGDGLISGGDFLVMSPFYGKRCTQPLPTPPAPTTSRYMYSTDSSPLGVLDTEGCTQGTAGTGGATILDFGGINPDGTTQLYRGAGNASLTNDITNAVKAFLRGFYRCRASNAGYLFLLIGTNTADTLQGNSINSSSGAAWADMVNQVNAWIDSPPSWGSLMQADAAIDIEPADGWASKDATVDWANAFSSETSSGYFNFGAAECPYTLGTSNAPCGNGAWTQEDIFNVSYGITAAFSIPEIYSRDGILAAEWEALAYYANNTGPPVHTQGAMFIEGAVTQSQACADFGGDPDCYAYHLDNPVGHGWAQLYALLYGDGYIPPNPLGWSTDFTKRN